jgi:hypothetical protein
MNIERLVELYHFVKAAPPEKVNMRVWIHREGRSGSEPISCGEFYNECGTAACLAGHAVVLFSPQFLAYSDNFYSQGKCLLDLPSEEANKLFVGRNSDGTVCTRDQALQRLQTLIEANGGTVQCP